MVVSVYSFFSGIGILDLGFENSGFKIDFVNEFNSNFLRAYQYARNIEKFIPKYGYSDVSAADFLDDTLWDSIFDEPNGADYIGFIGGPPCPDFSAAGQNKGHTGKNGVLTSVYSKLILKRKPDFFLLENVKGLYLTKKHREFYDTIKEELESDYFLYDTIENALEYGVPQSRERLFLVGFKKSAFKAPPDFYFGKHRIYDLNTIKQLPWPTTDAFVENGEHDCPPGIKDDLTVENWFVNNDVTNHSNAKDVFNTKSINRFTTIEEGNTRGKSFKRLHRWRYAPTSAYGNNEVHLHPYLPRRISVSEALAIQSLPKNFQVMPDLPLSAKFKMVGNGVPYLLAKGIASDIYEWLENNIIQGV